MSQTCPEFLDADPSDPRIDAQAFLQQAPEEEDDDEEEDEDDGKQDAEDDDEDDQGYSE